MLKKEVDDSQKPILEEIVDECNDSEALLGHANRQMNSCDKKRPHKTRTEIWILAFVCTVCTIYSMAIWWRYSKTAKELKIVAKSVTSYNTITEEAHLDYEWEVDSEGTDQEVAVTTAILHTIQAMDIQIEVGELDKLIQQTPERASTHRILSRKARHNREWG